MNINGSGIIRVLPDGSGFVIITQSPRDQDPIIVLQWFEELKAKVALLECSDQRVAHVGYLTKVYPKAR